MKLVKPSFEIITQIDKKELLTRREKTIRVCYKSEDRVEEGSAEKLLKNIIAKGHEAMLEFADVHVLAVCDRGVSHEIVRHRLASYAQESTRYCNYGKDEHMQFIIPCWLDIKESSYEKKTALQDASLLAGFPIETGEFHWLYSMWSAEETYTSLLKQGWTPQQARSVLPNSLKTEINMKMNLRAWRNFFKLRVAPAAHPQMRELAQPMLDAFKASIPLVFDDINY